MPVIWDAMADRKLFLAIMRNHNFKVDSKLVSSILNMDGMNVTPRTIEERLKRLRKLCQENASSSGDGDGEEPPVNKTKPAARRKRSNPKDNDDDHGKDDKHTPIKKARKAYGGETKPDEDTLVAPEEEEEITKEEWADEV